MHTGVGQNAERAEPDEAGPRMAKSFDALVKEGRDQGLDRAKAEARARDLFYGDPPPQATRLREPPCLLYTSPSPRDS